VKLQNGINNLSTAGLRQGLYLIVIRVNGEMRHSTRQVILK